MVCSWSCFLLFVFVVFFFFKQKTAYEMRISDWSSDVCSSDLPARVSAIELLCMSASTSDSRSSRRQEAWRAITLSRHPSFSFIDRLRARVGASVRRYRSEEHTSELQSLMRISYAVFCLKKKKIQRSIRIVQE